MTLQRLQKMAAAVRKKNLGDSEIRRLTAKYFRTFGIEVPRGELDAYRERLLEEVRRQNKIAFERGRRRPLPLPFKKLDPDALVLPEAIKMSIPGRGIETGPKARHLPYLLRRLEKTGCIRINEPDRMLLLFPGGYMLRVRKETEFLWNRYSKSWHRKNGPVPKVVGYFIELYRATPRGPALLLKDDSSLTSFHRGWERRALEAFLPQLEASLRNRLVSLMVAQVLVDTEGLFVGRLHERLKLDRNLIGCTCDGRVLFANSAQELLRALGPALVRLPEDKVQGVQVFRLEYSGQPAGYEARMRQICGIGSTIEEATALLVTHSLEDYQHQR